MAACLPDFGSGSGVLMQSARLSRESYNPLNRGGSVDILAGTADLMSPRRAKLGRE
ncbi:hypothetical protein KZX70_14570 [Paenibacillus silvae]|uniref:hypothetical protein n=1 Tax=Paenibacillus TaxID=44249 RepID=UPI00161CC247|nr:MULTISPECIES: hypothetical protein [Paenibacillus]MCK6076077.1 hypothetical protein [Paenibacillus silvae]MCK6150764.1 hypothetical protein [Paenibacillus silvae]MCK6269024.1 hypothetical protein [Paenibacillus silvae]